MIKRKLFIPAFAALMLSLSFSSCDDKDIAPVLIEQGVVTNASIDNINANIAAMRSFVTAKETGTTVKKVTRLADDNGCLIEFSDGNTLALRRKVGSVETAVTGEPNTPLIAVKADEAKAGGKQEYYWTIGEEWLCVPGTTERIPVTGTAAVTPSVDIDEAGNWIVDLGAHGTVNLGKAVAGEQLSSVKDIDVTDRDNVVIEFTSAIDPLHLAAGGGTWTPDDPVKGYLRRPIDQNHPAWLVHIDSWNYPDPKKIIDLIPDDILPYVIFNISLSVSHDEQTGRFRVSEYGYEICKSWLRTCAERNLWAMVQPASGGWCHFPDVSDYSQFNEEKYGVYKEFFEDYPNFLGFNYCEQFWGFDGHDPGLTSPTWDQRVEHWRHLLQLTHEYGGYLTYSFCANYWSAGINPVAMMKKHPEFAEAAVKYAENFIVCEKYTQSGKFFDVEAECLGVWLSGHCDHYGIRFDQCAWNEWAAAYYNLSNKEADFPVALGAALQLEHITLNGQTVIDGPELIWQQDFFEDGTESVGDGYQARRWRTFPQFRNINIDLFRKILDGTIRLLTRPEVIKRAKVAIIQDITSGAEIEQYCLPKWFHLGIGALDHDQGREDNHFYLRKTGRYPAMPVVANLVGPEANSFEFKYSQSAIKGWENQSAKTRELNRIFPSEYTGDLFAGRHENTWVTYNPWKEVHSANIPFKYNTAESMDLTFETFTTGVWKEYPDHVTCYLTNYSVDGKKAHSEIRINGAASRPNVNVKPRAEAYIEYDTFWEDGVLILKIDHNGPLDIDIACSGNATDRLTDYTPANIGVPARPNLYHGPRQSEAEVWDFKMIGARFGSGYEHKIRNYTGQGYINFGKLKGAAVRDNMDVIDEGRYSLQFRYRAESADITTVDLYVNGEKVDTPVFTQSGSDLNVWYVVSVPAYLKAGDNKIELISTAARPCDLYLDNMVIEPIP